MYAILSHGGRQYRVAAGDRLVVDRLSAEVGSVVALEPVLLVADGDRLDADGGTLEGVRLAATVVGHRRGKKLRIFKYKAKKRNRRTLGFRADLTELMIEKLVGKGEALPAPRSEETAVEVAEEVPAPRRRGRASKARGETAVDATEGAENAADASAEAVADLAEGDGSGEVLADILDDDQPEASDSPAATDPAPAKRRRADKKAAGTDPDPLSTEA